jgi:hypothetical protein
MIAVGLLLAAVTQDRPITRALAMATSSAERPASPVASPGAMPMTTPAYPLPAPADLATADIMTAGGAAMIQAAEGMAKAAQTMLASDDPAVVDLGKHWEQDAQTLRERGAWMILSETAGSMVHDPDKAHELDLYSLRGNGMSMAAEGQAMVDHGKEMATQVDQLRGDNTLSDEMADELAVEAQALITAGEGLVRDGERMQEYADKLLQSLGQ